MFKKALQITYFALSGLLLAGNAMAQHTDIWLQLQSNQVVVSPIDLETNATVAVDSGSGRYLFTGNFGDLGQGPDATDDPGFQAEAGTFNANAILYYRAVGALWFWDGSSWVNAVPDQERVLITDALDSVAVVDTQGVANADGAVDQINGAGSIHQHVEFAIDNSAGNGAAAAGAYLIDLEFYVTNGVGGSTVHSNSEPLRIAFNYQLNSADFDAALAALTTAAAPDINVPLPFFTPLVLAVLLLLVACCSAARQRVC